jgi:hypothetical protein
VGAGLMHDEAARHDASLLGGADRIQGVRDERLPT